MKITNKIDGSILETNVDIVAKTQEESDRINCALDAIDNCIVGINENVSKRVLCSNIMYFESVDKRTFAYTEDCVFEISYCLYEVESLMPYSFLRVSKSAILNLSKVVGFSREFSGRILANMSNKEKIIISRFYPGKSAEVSLSHKNYAYGNWVGEIISALKFDKIACFAGSFGAGILAKTMCVSPEKIKKAVLYVPSGIKNAPTINSISMALQMIMYRITYKQKWLEKCIMPMALTKENMSSDIFETAKCSIDFAKIKAGMPSNVKPADMKKCSAPTLVLAAEYDCLFPAKRVIPQAEKIISHCTTHLMKLRGHMNILTEEEKQMIVNFLL